MRNFLLPFFLLIVTYYLSPGQCDDYIVRGSQVFHGNDIRTTLLNGGDMFWDLDDARFQVPFENPKSPSAFFAAAVWIGGYSETGELKLSAQGYRRNGVDYQEYVPGPLTNDGSLFTSDCERWDTVWSVTANEILIHIADLGDNGIIDNPQESVFGWPALGNVHFENINGFPMPGYSQGYAPFNDRNSNGLYEPEQGEYPFPEGMDTVSLPDQITWHVFNDVRADKETGGAPTSCEIQQTTYAYFCGEDTLLNRTLFIDFQVINRGDSSLDSTYFGIWFDPDLGCYTDDMIGCSPSDNTFFIYNEDDVDGENGNNCLNGVVSYPEGPPAMSGTFLNREMSTFAYYLNGGVGSPPQGMVEPSAGFPIEFYRYLSGKWRDGMPITIGGSGYNPGSDDTTTFVFDGNPSDTSQWSMYQEELGFGDRRFVTSTRLGLIQAGQQEKVSMAFTLHLDPDRDHLGNVELMYEQVPEVQALYDAGLSVCPRPVAPCNDECVWPGDANNDGIANHYDVLPLGLAYGTQRTGRPGPLSWAPHDSESWDTILSTGLDVKYADMNGNGFVGVESEIDILDLHYGLTHSGYQEEYECNEGQEIVVDGGFELLNPNAFASRTSVYLNHDLVPELYGLAFTVLYDTTFFDFPTWINPTNPFGDTATTMFYKALGGHIGQEGKGGTIDYVVTRVNHENFTFTEETELLQFILHHNREDLIPGQPDTTEVCLADIRGILADGTEVPMGANTIQFIFLEQTSGVEDEREKEIVVYPNPSSGEVNIMADDDLRGASYELYNITGSVVNSGYFINADITLSLAPGVYTLLVRDLAKVFTNRIVIIE